MFFDPPFSPSLMQFHQKGISRKRGVVLTRNFEKSQIAESQSVCFLTSGINFWCNYAHYFELSRDRKRENGKRGGGLPTPKKQLIPGCLLVQKLRKYYEF